MARLFLRLDLGPGRALGPGKIGLLENIRDLGSISAAARAMKMSYRRAWLLIENLNASFDRPVIDASTGGKHGGGATLTRFGQEVIDRYRDMEATAEKTMAAHLKAFDRASAPRRAVKGRAGRGPRS